MALYKKRERTQNWTPEEKILLLKLCGTKINILENKKADQYSLTIKNSVWKEIHQEFIAKLGSDRDVLRLKEQWQRMKKQARSELQDYKMRTKKHGELAQLRKISNISEEVLKIMEIANKSNNSNTEEEDASISSSENSEQDNIPTYFCETEVKQEIDDKNDHDYQQKNFFINADDSEASLSSITAVINSQAKLKFNNHKNDSILNILNSYCHNPAEQQDTITINNKMKRKIKDSEEFQFLQSLFESKHKEHQKRMMIIEEQLKTAKIQRETAEIQKQIAQQELKHMLLQQGNQKEKRTTRDNNLYRNCTSEITDAHLLNEENYHKIHFHQNQIKLHEEEIDKHKQFMDEIIKKEYQN